jgi:hypothetical protein
VVVNEPLVLEVRVFTVVPSYVTVIVELGEK